MITKTFTGEGQFSEPLLLAPEQRALLEINGNASLTVSFQWILCPPGDDPSRPNDNDSRWATVEQFDAASTPVYHAGKFGSAWCRAAVIAGDYVSGSTAIKLSAQRAA